MTSLFDLFKIGIGPSSSHTVGPMRAARRFCLELEAAGLLEKTARITVGMYGSLALTGHGHGTDRAVILGLLGEQPDQVNPARIDAIVRQTRTDQQLRLLGKHAIPFHEADDLLWRRSEILPGHSNGMRYTAFSNDGSVPGSVAWQQIFYSVGGGFILAEGETAQSAANVQIPYPFHNAAELLSVAAGHNLKIWQLVLANESALRPVEEVRAGIQRIWNVMQTCTARGLETEGTLPGGLNVRRRAPEMHTKLLARKSADPLAGMDWLTLYAIAVNEENAAGGRVVTAPTNGAAGAIPAVAHYYRNFIAEANDEGLFRFFLTAAAIGALYKENASISGAEVGCQGEVGVACSMAAGGLVAALNGTNDEVEHAAEIAMEHNLGMTCDPIGGLVQIPCIERNAMGAVKAVNACRIAMNESGTHKVSLDQVIETMYRTGMDMQSRYKETSQAGLALNIIEC
ncbi:MAG TPA: L-serine ammonia-lyase [Acidobacteriaceae bacterium]|nr:L-serine ammonia-lyase [Acidobacteriaceae bacterium]